MIMAEAGPDRIKGDRDNGQAALLNPDLVPGILRPARVNAKNSNFAFIVLFVNLVALP